MNIVPDELIITLNKYIKTINENKEYGFDFELKNFIKSMSIIKPQSYGKRIENRIIKDLLAKPVPASDDRGDMLCGNKHIELKVSLLTETNKDLNLVQVRLWQEIDYYLCIAFDLRDLKNFKEYVYLLTKEEMKEEMKILNASSAHGTKAAIKNNQNKELRYSLNINENNKVFERWENKYKKNYEDLKKEII